VVGGRACHTQRVSPPEAVQVDSSTATKWELGCQLDFDVTEPAHMALLVSAARRPQLQVHDGLAVTVDGVGHAPAPIVDQRDDGQRTHLLELPVGAVSVTYHAQVTRPAAAADPAGDVAMPASSDDQLGYLRPSRYCPSDRIGGWAQREFGEPVPPEDRERQFQLARAVTSWVFERTDYVLGSSGGSDSAIDTLLTSEGVCRDFAHLVITICRALDLPARFASVYAPGLTPMDFHAVAEVCIGGQWYVHDATRLAPRSALTRIATGRDAADTAFVTVFRGRAELTGSDVVASTDQRLPSDAPEAPVQLA
jgi:transglutaminase-like putative cysteine protease